MKKLISFLPLVFTASLSSSETASKPDSGVDTGSTVTTNPTPTTDGAIDDSATAIDPGGQPGQRRHD